MKLPKIWWGLFLVSLVVIVPFMFPYLTLDPANSRITIIPGTVQYPLLVAHIVSAFIALLTGFLVCRPNSPEETKNTSFSWEGLCV